MKRALIVEDAPDVRTWLVDLVDGAFPGITIREAGTLTQALDLIDRQSFCLALIDINLPDGNGLTLLRALRERAPNTYCVMATIFEDDETIFRALQDGAQGYLLKQEPRERLRAGLQGILAGEPPLSPHVARRILSHFRKSSTNVAADSRLTTREGEVLTFVAKGLSREEIGRALGISPTTVATHIGAIYRKLDVSSRSEATVEAIRLGLVKP